MYRTSRHGSCRCGSHSLGRIGNTKFTVAYTTQHTDETSKTSFAKIAKQLLEKYPSASRLGSVDINASQDCSPYPNQKPGECAW
jgi:hypothetical protein